MELFDKICQRQILKQAFVKVKKNKGCFGVDRVSISQYENNLERNISELVRLIKAERYRPMPVKRVLIPKANGKKRPLGIPAVRDRIVQQAITIVIELIFEKEFSDISYGFRPRKSAHQAIGKVQEYLDAGYEYVVEADIRDFFGQLDQYRLMSKVHEHMKDTRVHKMIWKIVRAGIMEEGKMKKSISGTPQGGVISPLLANIYLNDFDRKITNAGLKLVRYADDFVILCKTVNDACYAMNMVRNIIGSIKLELAEEKTGVTEYKKGFDFLGYHFQKYYGKNYKWPSNKAFKAFKEEIREKTRRQQPRNVAEVIKIMNPSIRGWGNYFRYGNSKKRFSELDSWIRMRLRSFIEKKKWPSGKNWKYPNDHFKKLGLINLYDVLKHQQKLSLPI